MDIRFNPILFGDFIYPFDAVTSMLYKAFENTPAGRAVKESSEFLFDYINDAIFFKDRIDLIKYCCSKSLDVIEKDELVLEFGVYQGESLLIIGDVFNPYNIKCYGFDTFTGITNDWYFSPRVTLPNGTYTTNGIHPAGLAENVELITGDATQTIIEFLKKNSGNIRFAHFDMDIYQPTVKVLEYIKNRLCKGAILCFDEHHGYPGWKENEFRALNEIFHISEYKYLAFSSMSAAIKVK